jgi:nicotinamidase-related amidase
MEKSGGRGCALLVIDMQNDFLKPGGVLYFNDEADADPASDQAAA